MTEMTAADMVNALRDIEMLLQVISVSLCMILFFSIVGALTRWRGGD